MCISFSNFGLVFCLLFAYLCGSIPFGLIVSKVLKNVDIRKYGSGAIGSTNVARTLGSKYGAIVLFLDGLKAVIPLLLVKYIFPDSQSILALVTFFVIVGHIFPIWLRFSGGKGIASLLFSYFVLDYKLGLLFSLVWLFIFFTFRISAVSSLAAIMVTTIFSYFISVVYFILSLILLPIICYKHRDNVKRILNGTELKFINHKNGAAKKT